MPTSKQLWNQRKISSDSGTNPAGCQDMCRQCAAAQEVHTPVCTFWRALIVQRGMDPFSAHHGRVNIRRLTSNPRSVDTTLRIALTIPKGSRRKLKSAHCASWHRTMLPRPDRCQPPQTP